MKNDAVTSPDFSLRGYCSRSRIRGQPSGTRTVNMNRGMSREVQRSERSMPWQGWRDIATWSSGLIINVAGHKGGRWAGQLSLQTHTHPYTHTHTVDHHPYPWSTPSTASRWTWLKHKVHSYGSQILILTRFFFHARAGRLGFFLFLFGQLLIQSCSEMPKGEKMETNKHSKCEFLYISQRFWMQDASTVPGCVVKLYWMGTEVSECSADGNNTESYKCIPNLKRRQGDIYHTTSNRHTVIGSPAPTVRQRKNSRWVHKKKKIVKDKHRRRSSWGVFCSQQVTLHSLSWPCQWG